MKFSEIKVARIQRRLEAAIEAIAEDMESGELDSKVIASELDEVANMVQALESAGYEVEVDESLMDRLAAKRKKKVKKDEDEEDEKEEKGKKKKSFSDIRRRIAIRRALRRASDTKNASEDDKGETRMSLRERIEARRAQRDASEKSSFKSRIAALRNSVEE